MYKYLLIWISIRLKRDQILILKLWETNLVDKICKNVSVQWCQCCLSGWLQDYTLYSHGVHMILISLGFVIVRKFKQIATRTLRLRKSKCASCVALFDSLLNQTRRDFMFFIFMLKKIHWGNWYKLW